MRVAIVDICESTPKLKLRLGTRGCSGSHVITDQVELHIRSIECGGDFPVNAPLPIDMCNGCPPGMIPGTPAPSAYTPCGALPSSPIQTPVYLIYPALGVDNDGLTEFYFDGKLFKSPAGRYKAQVVVNACSCMEFDINLCCDPIGIEQIIVEGVSPCGESC